MSEEIRTTIRSDFTCFSYSIMLSIDGQL